MAQSTSKSRAVLNLHPSVQDLNIQYGGVNLFKTNVHKMLINHGPMHHMTPSELQVAQRRIGNDGAVTAEAGGQRVTVVKNGCSPAKVIPGFTTPSRKEAQCTIKSSISPHRIVDTGSSVSRSNSKHHNFSITSTSINKSATSPPICRVGKKVVTHIASNPQPSLVSTEFSYDSEGCSDCDRFSLYGCSCCHAKPPSTVASAATSASMENLSAYDNMSSVSQRLDMKNGTTVSVSSSKLQSLKEELEAERKSRIRTQEELEKIRRMQVVLISRLPYEERKNLENLMQPSQDKPMKRKVPSECAVGNTNNKDINDNCRAYRSKKQQVKFQSKADVGPFELEDGDSLFV